MLQETHAREYAASAGLATSDLKRFRSVRKCNYAAEPRGSGGGGRCFWLLERFRDVTAQSKIGLVETSRSADRE